MTVFPGGIFLTPAFNDPTLVHSVFKSVEADLRMLLRAERRPILAEHLDDKVGPDRMQPLKMNGIERVLLALEPVAIQMSVANVTNDAIHGEDVPAGQERRR